MQSEENKKKLPRVFIFITAAHLLRITSQGGMSDERFPRHLCRQLLITYICDTV